MLVLNTNPYNTFKSKQLHPVDLEYKKQLQTGLKDTYGITCSIEDLDPIAGPIETREIIDKLKPEQYAVEGEFRANFHLHTRASDGNYTTREFLDDCVAWGNKLFNKGGIKDDLPPFSAAITDHDSVDSTKEAIALISQEPKKYKNFKFISGCEFRFNGYKEPHPAFEAVGLGFNPFDKNLTELTLGRHKSHNHVNDIPKIKNSGGVLSWAHPIYLPGNINDNFFIFLKNNGIDGVESNYQYGRADEEYVKSGKEKLNPFIKKYNMFTTGGTDSHSKSLFGWARNRVKK